MSTRKIMLLSAALVSVAVLGGCEIRERVAAAAQQAASGAAAGGPTGAIIGGILGLITGGAGTAAAAVAARRRTQQAVGIVRAVQGVLDDGVLDDEHKAAVLATLSEYMDRGTKEAVRVLKDRAGI